MQARRHRYRGACGCSSMRHGHRNGGTAISEMEMRQVYRDEDTDIDATGSVKHASAPAAHATQSVSASLAVDARCLPAAQSTHAVAKNGDAAYFPAPHSMQSASPSLAVCLPAHRQGRTSAKE